MSRGANAMRITLLALLAAAAITAFVYWWLQNYERVPKTLDLPPRGEAAFNPLYPLKLSLLEEGRKVDARQRLALNEHPLRPVDTVLMLGDPRTLAGAESAALMTWVKKGGHLILRTPPPGVPVGDERVPVLGDLEVEPSDEASECMRLKIEGFEEHEEFCFGRRFFHDDADALSWDDEDTGESGFARFAYGEGSVDVLADLDFLTGDGLEDGPHYALARQLLQPNYADGGTFHLIYSADMPSLVELLFAHGWRVLLALALGLIAWLWMRAERFGPLLPSASPDRRSLLEHVQASGDHLYRYGRSATLYAAAHDAFMRRLRRRDPYAAALEGPAQIDAIARRTGMSHADVEAALRYPRPRDAADFTSRIARLLQLRRRL